MIAQFHVVGGSVSRASLCLRSRRPQVRILSGAPRARARRRNGKSRRRALAAPGGAPVTPVRPPATSGANVVQAVARYASTASRMTALAVVPCFST